MRFKKISSFFSIKWILPITFIFLLWCQDAFGWGEEEALIQKIDWLKKIVDRVVIAAAGVLAIYGGFKAYVAFQDENKSGSKELSKWIIGLFILGCMRDSHKECVSSKNIKKNS